MRVLIGLLAVALAGAAPLFAQQTEADGILAQLSAVRLQKDKIYSIRDITIRRDVLSLSFNRGAIAFLEPVNGKVTGAVFIGAGEIVAIPPNPTERQQISRFTGTPVLNEAFQTAVLRFTDNSYEEFQSEISQHAQEDVGKEEAARFDAWETSLAGRSAAINLRLLADLVEPARPIFFADLEGDRRGWFSVSFDSRAVEEVSLFQIRQIGASAAIDVWGSFNQRSDGRDLEPLAHETKSAVEILAYDIEGSSDQATVELTAAIRVKARRDGARVLNFDLSPSLRVTAVTSAVGEPVPFFRLAEARGLQIVLPTPLKASEESALKVAYTGSTSGPGPWYPAQRQSAAVPVRSSVALPEDRSVPRLKYAGHSVAAASYHDHWLIEGLTRYLDALSAGDSGEKLQALLDDSRRQLKPDDTDGPIALGSRLVSTLTPDAGAAFSAKAIWVVHMLRGIMKRPGPDPDAAFNAALGEFAAAFDGAEASTWDFKQAAEKQAGGKLDWFFDQWVFATGLPSYSVDYKIDAQGNEFTIEGTLVQTGVPDGFTMPVPLYADTTYLGTVQAGESEGRFQFRTAARPDKIVIDPDASILQRPALPGESPR